MDHLGEVVPPGVIPQQGEVGQVRVKSVRQSKSGQGVFQLSRPLLLKFGQGQAEEEGLIPAGEEGGQPLPGEGGQQLNLLKCSHIDM